MKAITIYTMEYCPYCERAKKLLTARGLTYTEKKVDVDDAEQWAALERKTGMKTLPQIFFDEKCIGGFTELDALDRSGKLQETLS